MLVTGVHLAAAPILPPWVVIPLGAGLMLAVGAHLSAIRVADLPPARKRIRTVNGVVMLMTAPLLCYAMTVPSSTRPRTFVLIWMGIIGLIALMLLLAGFDAAATLRDNLRSRRVLRQELRDNLQKISRRHRSGSPPGSTSHEGPA